MAKDKIETTELTEVLPTVDVLSSSDVLAQSVVDSKATESTYVTNTAEAKSIEDIGGTVVVRW